MSDEWVKQQQAKADALRAKGEALGQAGRAAMGAYLSLVAIAVIAFLMWAVIF